MKSRLKSVLVLCLGLLTALALTPALPASAAPAAPVGLTPDGVNISGTPVLAWDPVPAATGYDVEVSSDPGFASKLYSVSTVNRRATPTMQLPTGETFWRVRAKGDSGTSGWSTATFTRDQLAGPALTSPASGAVLAQPTEPALLSWTPLNGVKSYTIEIDDSDDFIGATTHTTSTSSFVMPSPQVATTYHWRVRATLGTGIFTEWSEIRTYEILGLERADLLSPADSASTVVDDVVLRWKPVPGAKTYDLQVSTDRNFNTLEASEANITGTTWSPSRTLNNDQYFWRIRPVDALGNKLDWPVDTNNDDEADDVWTFRRAWPDQADLEYPAHNSTVGDPFYYQWKPVRLASYYVVQLSSSGAFNANPLSGCKTVHTTYTPTEDGNCWPEDAGKSYYWRVTAVDEDEDVVTDAISAEVHRFVYQPELLTVVAPSDGSTVTTPTLEWEAVSSAVRYRVTITPVGDGAAGGTFFTYSTTYTPRSLLTPGATYRWSVQAISESGRFGAVPAEESQHTFTVAEPPAATAATPEPTSPSNGASFGRFPALSWTPVTGATRYRIEVRRSGESTFTELADNFVYATGQDDEDDWLTPGGYQWRVKAFAGSNLLSTSSTIRSFTIAGFDTVVGQRVALTGSALGADATSCDTAIPNQCADLRQTPILKWDAQPYAATYIVWISRDKEMTNLIGKYQTESNQWTRPTALFDSQAGSAFYWHVQPCGVNVCAAPQHAAHAFNKLSNDVELLSPAEGAEVANDVTLSWRDYLATNLDASPGHLDETGVPARIEAKQYRVQIDDTPNFQSPLETVVVDQTTFTSFKRTYPEGPVYWRVQAIDGSGNNLSWSEPRMFLKRSPVPTLVSPTDGAVVGTTEPFRWDPLDFAGSYDIEVYKNDDTTGSSTNRVVNGNSKQVAFSLTTPLPAEGSPYRWRVRRVDATGLKGGWSELAAPGARFVIQGTPPVLLTPEADAFLGARDSLFSWQAVDGAASYKFERRAEGSGSTAENVTTVGLAWAPAKALPDGAWEWRVTTLDTAGKPIASSAWRDFDVDGTNPTVKSYSPRDTAKTKANFKVTFSEPVTGADSTTIKLYKKGTRQPLSAKVTLAGTGPTATLNPTKNLTKRKLYTVKVQAGITDAAGNEVMPMSWKVKAK